MQENKCQNRYQYMKMYYYYGKFPSIWRITDFKIKLRPKS